MSSAEKDIQSECVEYTNTQKGTKDASDVVLINDQGEIRRIPVPSEDPNDPLNFNKFHKMGIMICCCWFSIFSLALVGGTGPILNYLFQIYVPQGKTIQEVVNLTTYPSLVMAFGAFLILPCAMIFGRRPTFLCCTILLVGATIGSATAKDYNTHLATRILQGVAAGATESLLPLIITDMSFLDERGFWFGLYWAIQSTVNTVFLIGGSYLVQATSWRWFYWILAIFAIIGLIGGFFFLHETRWQRSPTAIDGKVIHTDEWGVTHVLSDAEALERFGHVTEITETAEPTMKKSYLQRLKVYEGKAPNALGLLTGANKKMFKSCGSPGVVYALLLSSISIGIGIAMSVTYGSILGSKFHWSDEKVGIIPASICAMVYSGWLGDKINIFLAKRRGGVHIPEDSLVTLIFPLIVGAIGIVIYGLSAQSPLKYGVWGLIMGWSLYEFSFIVVLIVTTQFASEAYPHYPGPALVVVVGAKNVISFAASYGITPMVAKYSYVKAFMILFACFTGISLLGIPVYFINPKWRASILRKEKQ